MTVTRRELMVAGLTLFGAAACNSTGTSMVTTTDGTTFLYAPKGEPYSVEPVNLSKIPENYHRQRVRNRTGQSAGTIVVDPDSKYLYLTESNGTAVRYGIGVGRAGFGWDGEAEIKAKRKWPAWHPPKEMQERDPEAAKWANGMPGGSTNPIGARGLYLYQGNKDTLYRIHGTAEVWSIGRAVSSGCIRMLNADVIDLYDRVPMGTRVVVRKSRGEVITDAAEAFGEGIVEAFRNATDNI